MRQYLYCLGLVLVLRFIVLVLTVTISVLVLLLPLLSWSWVSRPRQFKIYVDWWAASVKSHCYFTLVLMQWFCHVNRPVFFNCQILLKTVYFEMHLSSCGIFNADFTNHFLLTLSHKTRPSWHLEMHFNKIYEFVDKFGLFSIKIN